MDEANQSPDHIVARGLCHAYGEAVVLETRLAGHTQDGHVVLRHHMGDGAGGAFAEAITVRRMSDGFDLAGAFGG